MKQATFTLAVYEASSKTFAIVTASNFLAVGSLVPWIDLKAGLVVTQSQANPAGAKQILEHMAAGMSAQESLHQFIQADPQARVRQLGAIDTRGTIATFSGTDCVTEVEEYVGANFFAVGNMLKPGTIPALVESFQQNYPQRQTLVDAMLCAMQAAERHGGDKRGKLAASLLVKRGGAGYQGNSDTLADLRVDASAKPLEKLSYLWRVNQLYRAHHHSVDWQKITEITAPQRAVFEHLIEVLASRSGRSAPALDEGAAIAEILGLHNLGVLYNPTEKSLHPQLLTGASALLELLQD